MKEGTLEQFYHDMEQGVYNFTKDGKCISCGNCCTALLPVTKKELKIIKRYAKRKHIKPVNHENVNFDLTCPFRDDEKKVCMIYEVRPFICRTFICNKPQNKTEWERDGLSFNSDFHVINLRLLF